MRLLAIITLASALAWPGLALAGEVTPKEAGPMTSTRMSLEQRVGSEVFQQAGLNKLSPEEQWTLADWIRDYTREITAYVEREVRREAGGKPQP